MGIRHKILLLSLTLLPANSTYSQNINSPFEKYSRFGFQIDRPTERKEWRCVKSVSIDSTGIKAQLKVSLFFRARAKNWNARGEMVHKACLFPYPRPHPKKYRSTEFTYHANGEIASKKIYRSSNRSRGTCTRSQYDEKGHMIQREKCMDFK